MADELGLRLANLIDFFRREGLSLTESARHAHVYVVTFPNG